MEAIWILLVLFLVCAGAGVYATARAVKAAKRGIDRTVHQARRSVEDTRLRARQFAQPGTAGELAELRLSLRSSMHATEQALTASAEQDRSLSESLDLFRRLSEHGRELEEELKRLERDPDKARVTALLPELRDRTQRITHSADSLRWAARDRAQRFAQDDLDTLGREIDVEAGALRHWTSESEEPSGAGAPSASSSSPRSGSEGAAGRASAQEPPSIGTTPRAEGYAWQKPWRKSARPENTA
ncbi:hypothetical protein [Streptomyces cucumeris]|uniref:hypothetical protein n=1 Tax=Streptomyces cucumeris TaxID=2962890 RepID=UPI0020C8CF16|nr:hypothetical protein [Streptomyces sp. NEAU-Y11]MCP9207324.1 hypothetical protein [Streptomyces sp. NEAU-Y11]